MIHHFIAAYLRRLLSVDVTIDLPRSATVRDFLCVRLLHSPVEYMIGRSPLSPESTISIIAHGVSPAVITSALHEICSAYIQNEAESETLWIDRCALSDQSTYLIPVEGGQAISAWQQIWEISHALP